MKYRGFTLIELLFVLFLAALVSAINLSYYSSMNDKAEKKLMIQELNSVFEFAKMLSVAQGLDLTITPLSNDLNWASGAQLQSRKSLDQLYQWHWHHKSWTLNWSGTHQNHIINISADPISSMSNGRFILRSKITGELVYLTLNRLGRVVVVE